MGQVGRVPENWFPRSLKSSASSDKQPPFWGVQMFDVNLYVHLTIPRFGLAPTPLGCTGRQIGGAGARIGYTP
jgi:hypothetical protein